MEHVVAPVTLQTFPTDWPLINMSIWLYVDRFPELPAVNETVAVPLLKVAITFVGAVGFE